MIAAAFEVVRADGLPATVAGTDARIIDQYEWLQLTLGRFLAPAREKAGAVEYLILGSPDGFDAPGGDVEAEVSAFRQAIYQAGEHLKEQISSTHLTRTHVLLSLEVLLELRFPEADDADAFHLRGGLLQIARWGLSSGPKLGELIRDAAGQSVPSNYFTRLKAALTKKARDEAKANAIRPSNNGAAEARSDYRPAPPPAPAGHLPRTPERLRPADSRELDEAPARKPPAPKKEPQQSRLANIEKNIAEDEEKNGKPQNLFARVKRFMSAVARSYSEQPHWDQILFGIVYLVAGVLLGGLLYQRYGSPKVETPPAHEQSVVAGPVIQVQPVDQLCTEGETATFQFTASNIEGVLIQWQESKEGTTFNDIPGATLNPYKPKAQLPQNGYRYRAVIGSAQTRTDAVTLTVFPAPKITRPPLNIEVPKGEIARFEVGLSDNPTATVQWQIRRPGEKEFGDLRGKMLKECEIAPESDAYVNNAEFVAVVKDRAGRVVDTSSSATLTIRTPLTINSWPEQQNKKAGDTVIFTADCDGIPAPTAKWQFRRDAGQPFSDLKDASIKMATEHNGPKTIARLTIERLKPAQAGEYRAVFSRPRDPDEKTEAATLKVEQPKPPETKPADVSSPSTAQSRPPTPDGTRHN